MPLFSINKQALHPVDHYGTGNLELTIKNETDLEVAKQHIETTYRRVGG